MDEELQGEEAVLAHFGVPWDSLEEETVLANFGFYWNAGTRTWCLSDENGESEYDYPAPDYETARAAALEYIHAIARIDIRDEYWLTMAEAAELLGRSVWHVRKLIRKGYLDAQRPSRRGWSQVWRPSVLAYKAHLRALERGQAQKGDTR